MATKKKTKKDWIGGAVKRPGAFTAYANKVLKKGAKASAQTKRQARLAKTFKKMAPKKKKTSKKKK